MQDWSTKFLVTDIQGSFQLQFASFLLYPSGDQETWFQLVDSILLHFFKQGKIFGVYIVKNLCSCTVHSRIQICLKRLNSQSFSQIGI